MMRATYIVGLVCLIVLIWSYYNVKAQPVPSNTDPDLMETRPGWCMADFDGNRQLHIKRTEVDAIEVGPKGDHWQAIVFLAGEQRRLDFTMKQGANAFVDFVIDGENNP